MAERDLPYTLVWDDGPSARAAFRRVAEAATRAADSMQRLAQTTRELDTDPKD